ncbi:MAG: NADH-quinone oxidoreductase subunit N [Bdellovibrionales bacterium]
MEPIVTAKDIALVSPIFPLFLTSLIPLTVKVMRNNREQAPILGLFQALIGIIISFSLIYLQTVSGSVSAFQNALIFNGSSFWIGATVCMIGIFSIFISYKNINTRGSQFSEHIFLILVSMIGMLVMAWANDLIVVFIGLEIMSLAVYVLVALSHEQILSKEAAFKYFILGSMSSAIFLYGVALLYGAAGSTYLDSIATVAVSSGGSGIIFMMGSLLTLIGMLFKVSIFPFHSWTPDVYQGAPTSVMAFMSTGVKVASFVVIIKFIQTGIMADGGSIFVILQWLAVLTIIVGNVAAIIQDNVKRILAYSSIAHSGYILIGVIVVGLGGDSNIGYSSTIFYLITYCIVNLGMLSMVSMFEKNEGTQMSVDDLRGLASKRPWLAMAITIMLLSLAGIPPLVGFFGKFYIFSGAVDMGLYWLALWGVLGSVISVYYYLRPIVNMYMREPEGDLLPNTDSFGSLNIALCVFLLVALGVLAGVFFDNIQNSLIAGL